MTTRIEWTEQTWNPSIGCTKISPGCKFCYAESFSKRLQAMKLPEYKHGFKFKIIPERLSKPLHIKKPTMFFVNSMSDLFHENMPYSYLDQIFEIIQQTPRHIYQVLTKRPENMLKYLQNKIIPKNVWLGVSVENANYVHRIDMLKQVNAKVRFISFEPLIGAVGTIDLNDIHWIIVGGESGHKARKMEKIWIEEIFQQCQQYSIPFFFKQWGTWGEDGKKRNKKTNGRLFRGKEWNEYPIGGQK